MEARKKIRSDMNLGFLAIATFVFMIFIFIVLGIAAYEDYKIYSSEDYKDCVRNNVRIYCKDNNMTIYKSNNLGYKCMSDISLEEIPMLEGIRSLCILEEKENE